MLDDIFSQISQRNFSSTQLFRSNSEYFDKTRNKSSTKSVDLSFDYEIAFPKGTYQSHRGQNHDKWFTGASHVSYSRNSKPSLFIDDEDGYEGEEVVQDSPELFTQRSDFHMDTTRNPQGRIVNLFLHVSYTVNS